MSTATPAARKPRRAKIASPQASESPGNWQHPRIQEITHRQGASVFSSDNIKTIVYNLSAIVIIHLIGVLIAGFGPAQLREVTAKRHVQWASLAAQAFSALNIVMAFLPLVRPRDDLSDIPLTPGQRQLLGLPPSSAPPTPNSVYSTPPRYARTPSLSGSIGKASPTSSPFSTEGSHASNPRAHVSPYSPAASPLFQKAMGYNGNRGSPYGAQNPFNASTTPFNLSTNSSIVSEAPSTPSPTGGQKISVGLNSRWLYDRTRRNTGSVWA